jgi:hypothetical protein
MFKSFALAALIALAGLVQTGRTQWVDYDSMIKEAVARQNELVRAAERNGREIVEHNMNDPRIQELYRAHRMQGGQMTLEQFAYWYAATAGGTNVEGYIDNERGIAEKEARAVKEYHEHVGRVWGEVKDHRDGVNDRIAGGRGNLLRGGWNFENPHTGGTEFLPTNVSTGHTETDYYGGRRTMTPGGSYEYTAPYGWTFPMFPVWGR